MNAECYTEKQGHNIQTDEAEIETIKAELEMATEKVVYFENLIVAANSMRKLAEDKIIQTQSKKLDSLSNKLDSQIQSFGELLRKAETKREEEINKLLDTKVKLIVVEIGYCTQSSQIFKDNIGLTYQVQNKV